jgi:hypothetical protein
MLFCSCSNFEGTKTVHFPLNRSCFLYVQGKKKKVRDKFFRSCFWILCKVSILFCQDTIHVRSRKSKSIHPKNTFMLKHYVQSRKPFMSRNCTCFLNVWARKSFMSRKPFMQNNPLCSCFQGREFCMCRKYKNHSCSNFMLNSWKNPFMFS